MLYTYSNASEAHFEIGAAVCGDDTHEIRREFTLGVLELIIEARVGVCSDSATQTSWLVLVAPEIKGISEPASKDLTTPTDDSNDDSPRTPHHAELPRFDKMGGRPVTRDNPTFDAEHLAVPFEPASPADDLTLPNLYVGLDIDLVAPGDGIVTDRHHASSDRYEADDAQNMIGGQLSPFALSGWLRHGCEAVLQAAGTTACHPGERNANFARENVYERDLESGYHPKGSCTDDHEEGCVIHELFGSFGNQPGKLVRRPVSFSPVRSQVDVLDGEAEAHYRQLASHVRSRNEKDGGQPLRHAEKDVLGNLEGTWLLTLRDLKPEFVGLLLEAISFLDAHSEEYSFQLGGSRNFGAGVADVQIVNPLYTDAEIKRVYSRSYGPSQAMEEKDAEWASTHRPRFVAALQARIAARDDDVPMPSGDVATGGDSE